MQNNILKDVAIGEASYRVTKMDSDTGSWLLMLLMGKLSEMPAEAEDAQQQAKPQEVKPEDACKAAVNFMLMKLSKRELKEVQREALSCCFKLVNDIPMPIIMRDGRYAVTELQFDTETVMQLVNTSLYNNMLPFFAEGKLMKLLMPI